MQSTGGNVSNLPLDGEAASSADEWKCRMALETCGSVLRFAFGYIIKRTNLEASLGLESWLEWVVGSL